MRSTIVKTLTIGCLVSIGYFAVASDILEPRSEQPASKEDLNFARSLSRAFRTVGTKVEPSVVHITQLNKVSQVQRDIFGFPVAVGPERLQATGLGSGFFVSTDGFIVTNNHVVARAQQFRVRFFDGRELDAKLVGADAATDLAVLKVEGSGYEPIEFGDSDALEQGDWVVAVGSPLGLSNSMTAGIVSALGRSGIGGLQSFQDFIQTDAAINPGNSGGPLVDLEGKLVGVNSAIASRSGGYEGIGFAIPSKIAQSVMNSLIKTGRVQRGWLGVSFERAVQDPTRKSLRGVQIAGVDDGGPAASAGIRPGDVIVEFDGRPVDSDERLTSLIALTPPDTQVTLGVLRGNSKETFKTKVADQNTAAKAAGLVYIADIGITVKDLTTQEIRAINAASRRTAIRSGVVVVQVEGGSRAEGAEFQPGDKIISVDEQAVTSAADLAKLAPSFDFNRGVNIGVVRGRQRGSISIQD